MKKILPVLLLIMFAAATSQNIFAQQKAGAAKKLLVNQLVEKTYKIYPLKMFSGVIEDTEGSLAGAFKTEMAATLNALIDKQDGASDEKKAAAKTKVPKLAERMAARIGEIIRADFTPDLWVKENLRQNLSKKFSIAELKKLNVFFGSPDAKIFIEAFARELENSTGNPADEAREKFEATPAFAKFEKSRLSAKFLDNFFGNTDYLTGKIDKWSDKMSKILDEDMEKGEFKRLIEAFISENFQ